MRLLLDAGAATESEEASFTKLLDTASNFADSAIVQLISNSGARTKTATRRCGPSLLQNAGRRRYANMVKLLNEAKAHIEPEDNDIKAFLQAAAFKGDEATVKILVEAGVSPDTKDLDGCTPLYYAALKGHVGVTKLLKSITYRED